ncbi:MAG TPA: phosphatidylglycerophosphatase A [Methylophilaceae bacterium]|nr:phosphatidylglycerophosphatase A [Methylophilaceae bacterium]
MLRQPSHLLAFGFGSGLVPYAPGTAATLIAMPLFLLLMQTPELVHYTTLAVLFVLGIPICAKTNVTLGVSDHSSIVWDEIVAFMLVLEFTPASPLWWLAAFLLFRLFDIWKPFPIHYYDMRIHGGFGVMFDDLLAAVYSILSLKGIEWLMMHY